MPTVFDHATKSLKRNDDLLRDNQSALWLLIAEMKNIDPHYGFEACVKDELRFRGDYLPRPVAIVREFKQKRKKRDRALIEVYVTDGETLNELKREWQREGYSGLCFSEDLGQCRAGGPPLLSTDVLAALRRRGIVGRD